MFECGFLDLEILSVLHLSGWKAMPTFFPILQVDASPPVGFQHLYHSLSFCTVCSLLKVHIKS